MLSSNNSTVSQRPVVLVTGAARRVGRAIVHELAANGFDVAVHYRSSAVQADETVQIARQLGARAQAFSADLSDETQCRNLPEQILEHFSRWDAVVNNASIFEYDNPQSFSYAALQAHLVSNTAPAVVLAQLLYQHLAPQKQQGSVVNLTDQKLQQLNPDYFSYTLSKSALQTATTMLAQALAPWVRVCSVAPGLMLGSELIDEARLVELQSATLLKKGVQPAELAQAVRFLIQTPSLTNANLVIDAGSHLQAAPRDFAFLKPTAS
jgi:NAD(P)-dependent dehydrogenase (short-subunit alcohol dehydrogenase family)